MISKCNIDEINKPLFMKNIIDKNRKQRAIFTWEVRLGRSKNDGLPRNSIGATLICYSTGIDEEEAVREAVATLKRSNMSPLNVVGYGSIEERLKNGHEIDLEENKIMLRALNENSVIVADVMPLFGNETEEDIVNWDVSYFLI